MKLANVKAYPVILHLCLLGLSVQTLALVKQNRELKQAPAQRPAVAQPAEGTPIRPMAIRELDGREASLSFDGTEKETLLLIFTTTCPACQRNQENWKALYERTRDRYAVIGISVDEAQATRDYIRDYSLPFRVVLPRDVKSFPKEYELPGVPQTILVDRDGKVKRVQTGMLPAEHIDPWL